MFRRFTASALGLAFLSAGFTAAPVSAEGPPYHVLSSQDLCNLIWPGSAATPDPAKPVGAICTRQGGVLSRMAKAMPNLFQDTVALEPGKSPELPDGSVRLDPNDPLSDWVIPDCDVPGRVDCG